MTPKRQSIVRGPRAVAIGLMLAVALGAGAGACSGDNDDDATVDGGGAEVVMELVAFKPEQLEVDAGTAVTWRNRDIGAHTVTSGTVEQGGAGVTRKPDGTFDSSELAKGETFSHTFDEPGTYRYFCSLHPATMRGEIRVT